MDDVVRGLQIQDIFKVVIINDLWFFSLAFRQTAKQDIDMILLLGLDQPVQRYQTPTILG